MGWARAVIISIAIASGAQVAGAQTPAIPVGLGPYILGMTIDEAKAVPIRPVMSEKGVRLMCSPEDNATYTSKEMIAEGVAECVPGYQFMSMKMATSVYFGDIILQPTLRFIDGRLYQIVASPHMNWSQQFVDALQLKYGKPAQSTATEVQNAFGAKWPKLTIAYKLGGQSILVEAPGDTRDKMFVEYSDTAIVSRITAAIRARKAAGAGI